MKTTEEDFEDYDYAEPMTWRERMDEYAFRALPYALGLAAFVILVFLGCLFATRFENPGAGSQWAGELNATLKTLKAQRGGAE